MKYLVSWTYRFNGSAADNVGSRADDSQQVFDASQVVHIARVEVHHVHADDLRPRGTRCALYGPGRRRHPRTDRFDEIGSGRLAGV